MSDQYSDTRRSSETVLSARIPKQPKPLHYTFYLNTGPNREQRRPSALKAKKNGAIRRRSRFNTTYREVKACVKRYSLRQHRHTTISEFIKEIKNV